MKSVTDTLLDRRTCRRYEREPISDEHMNLIYDAIRNTPTSYNGQQYSVIDVTDRDLKERLYAITGQKQIKTCSHFLVFLADYYKIEAGARQLGVDTVPFYNTVDGLTVGMVDAALAMMSAIVAAESCGLGTCPIGYARTADPEAIAKELDLPEHVMVVCGLAIGVPREHNDLKPKQSRDLIFHSDRYSTEGIGEKVAAYDATIRAYNATRSGATTDNGWVDHMEGYYREAMNYRMLEALRNRGFDVER